MIPLHDDNPTEGRPVVTVALIVACVLAWLWQVSLGDKEERVVLALGFIPAVLFGEARLDGTLALVPPGATLFTSMFLHGGLLHLGGNMLYLWIFGNNVEDSMGHGRFLLFYLVCGLVAAMAQAAVNPASTIPMIGASGAISGVLGAYLLLYPRARVLVGIPIVLYLYTVRLPAAVVLGLWFVFQLLSSAGASGEGGGVAFMAHAGGFVAGLVLVALFKRRDVPLLQPARPSVQGLVQVERR